MSDINSAATAYSNAFTAAQAAAANRDAAALAVAAAQAALVIAAQAVDTANVDCENAGGNLLKAVLDNAAPVTSMRAGRTAIVNTNDVGFVTGVAVV